MPSSISVGTQNVTGTVTTTIQNLGLPSLSTGQTLVRGECRGQPAASTTLITVSAGKTFYCLGAEMTSSQACEMYIVANGVEVLVADLVVNSGISFSGGILFSAPANSTITVISNSAGKGCAVWGYEA